MIKSIPMRLIAISILTAIVVSFPAIPEAQTMPRKNPLSKRIAITFDNLPAETVYGPAERRQINQFILAAFKELNVVSAGFVVGDNIAQDWELIIDWLEAGHVIGFHPYSGQRVDDVPLLYFFDDIIKGRDALESILDTYEQPGRYFRLPFLYSGTTRSNREELLSVLKREKVTLVDASIVTEDFVYNLSLEKMGHTQDSAKINNLRDQYVAHIMVAVGRAEELSQKLLGRQPKQILKLQANRINALFLRNILAALKDSGYKFVSLSQALQDSLYKRRDAYFDDSRQLSLLERLLLSDPDSIPAEEE